MAPQREYRDLNKLSPETAAAYPAAPITSKTPIYRDILFSDITATVQSGRRAGLIWGLPEAPVRNLVLRNVTITADRPLGIYNAQGVRIEHCNITTPEEVEPLVSSNAQFEGKVDLPLRAPQPKPVEIAADGSGDFKTIQEAFALSKESAVLHLKPGIYEGPIIVPASKAHITFRGDDAEKTIITWNRNMER